MQHAWSLSIEEQFYLLWPVVLLASIRRGIARPLAIVVLMAMPVLRVILFIAFGHDNRLIVDCSSVDMLMAGSLLAVLSGNHTWRRWCDRRITAWSATGLAALGLVLVPYVDAKLAGTSFSVVSIALAYSITALSIGAVLEYIVRTPRSLSGKLLNLRAVRHVGVISYSIYLWQQLFTENPATFGVLTYVLIR